MAVQKILDRICALESRTRDLASGAELYRQGEKCGSYFLITKGWIALSALLHDGQCQILDFVTPGALLGFPLLSSMVRSHSARCITPARVVCYSEPQLTRAIVRDAELAVLLCRQAALDEWRAHDHLVNVCLRSARERIAHLLLELCTRIRGRIPSAGDTIRIPLTQAHIGQALGLTGVHVSRTLRVLREQGIVRFIKRDLQILDSSALARAAGMVGTASGLPPLSHRLPPSIGAWRFRGGEALPAA